MNNPKNTPSTNRGHLTTEALGVAQAKAQDLKGYIINPSEIADAVARTFTIIGINAEEIKSVKTAVDSEGKPRLIVEIRWKAVKSGGDEPKERNVAITSFFSGDSDEHNDSGLKRGIYECLRNKAFYGKNKNLSWKKFEFKDSKYVAIEFDPYMFIAFVYDINYADRFYKISAPAVRLKSQDEIDEMSGKERRAYQKEINEYKNAGLRPATFYVTFRTKSTFKTKNGDTISGFHPDEVVFVHQKDEDDD